MVFTAFFGVFSDEYWVAAFGAFFCQGIIPRREFAIGVLAAAVEYFSFFGLLMDQLTLMALRAFYLRADRFRVLAVWISAAGVEFAKATMLD